jgi:hypothetical protein
MLTFAYILTKSWATHDGEMTLQNRPMAAPTLVRGSWLEGDDIVRLSSGSDDS